jgi:hypothetical protein
MPSADPARAAHRHPSAAREPLPLEHVGPNCDPDARTAFVAACVAPLHPLRHRLSPALRRLASLITNDVSLDLVWIDQEPTTAVTASQTLRMQILLYSLDEG